MQLSVFLGEEKRRALSHPEADVYEALCELFAGREVTLGQREIARRAVVDQGQVPGALRMLQRVHLIVYETSPTGTQVTILPESDEALAALRHLAQERGGAVPPSTGSERRYQQALRALRARGVRLPLRLPDDEGLGRGRERPRPGGPPRAEAPQRAEGAHPEGGEPGPFGGELRGPESCAVPDPVEAPAVGLWASAPGAGPPPAGAGEGAAEGSGEGAPGEAEEPPRGDEEGSSPGDEEGSSPGAGPPNYSLDQSDKIPPSPPPPASSAAAVGGEEPAVAEPPPAALAEPPPSPVAAELRGASPPPAEAGPRTADPLALALLVTLASSLWPKMAPKVLRDWLERGMGLVQPAPSQAEMAAYLQWAAQDESLARAQHPLAAAMTAHRLVPWLEKRRARPVPPTAARAPFRPAATRPPQRPTAEERADYLRQCAVNARGMSRWIEHLNAPLAVRAGGRRR